MTDTPTLQGSTVLVVEDDFYLADDARDALERAGAHVLGPAADIGEALQLLRDAVPDCAVTDVNLGGQPSFDLARMMIDRGIPMLFATGYDAAAIPSEFAAIPRLQKPLDLRKLVATVAELRRVAIAEA